MSLTAQQLYELLPAIYRIRDAERGEPLKALAGVIAEQGAVMEADIARLYENWFVETCDEWVVSYIGDLLGVRGLHALGANAPFSHRALVANTLGYRRRKGTATMLEQLARDTTGWNARAAEFFQLLATTQNYNHVTLGSHHTPDIRDTNRLELIETAFDTTAHTADVRSIVLGRGRHNIPNIGLFIWRLQSYFVPYATAQSVADPTDGRFTFNPLGDDAPLFNKPQPETEIAHLAEEINVPGLLRRRALYDELEARRQAQVDNRTPAQSYFASQPVLEVFVQAKAGKPFVEVPPEEILICNLVEPPAAVPEVWLRPQTTKLYQPTAGGAKVPRTIQVAVDPVLGRIAFPKGVKPNAVKVSYAYGFSGDVGGGPYNREESVTETLSRKATWEVGVSKAVTPVPGKIFATLTDAIAQWNALPAGSVGVIAVMDNETYEEDLTAANRIKIPEGSFLLIVAADWPEAPVPGDLSGAKQRVLEPDERRPVLRGNVSVTGTAPAASSTPGTLALNGLLIEGDLTVVAAAGGNLGSLDATHCTVVPGKGALSVTSKNNNLKISLTRSICGPIALPESVHTLRIAQSIVDGAGKAAIDAEATAVAVEQSTMFGVVSVREIEASNSVFAGALTVIRRQAGCVRFSYVSRDSQTPRRFRCQPDLALEGVTPAQQSMVIARLVPSFTSEDYGHYGYGQLSLSCAPEIATGAEDGSEKGVFSFLKQPQRLTNLETGLGEYLRFGLEAGIIYVT